MRVYSLQFFFSLLDKTPPLLVRLLCFPGSVSFKSIKPVSKRPYCFFPLRALFSFAEVPFQSSNLPFSWRFFFSPLNLVQRSASFSPFPLQFFRLIISPLSPRPSSSFRTSSSPWIKALFPRCVFSYSVLWSMEICFFPPRFFFFGPDRGECRARFPLPLPRCDQTFPDVFA